MNKNFRHLLEFQFAVLCMSTSGSLGKFITLAPALTIFYRAFFACIVLYFICQYKKSNISIKSNKDRRVIIISSILMAAHWVTYFVALDLSNIAIGMLSVFTFPVITSFLEPIILKTKFEWGNVILGLITLIGIVFLIPEFTLSNAVTQGAAFGLLSAFLYAVRNIMLKPVSGTYGGSVLMFYQMLISSIVLIPTCFIYSSENLVSFLPHLGILALVTTAIGHSILIKSFQYFSVTKASIMSMIQPLYGIILGVIFLRDIPNGKVVIGGIVIIITTIIISLRKNKKELEVTV